MNNETFDPSVASGESAMRGSRPLELNEVSLNGDGSAKQVAPGKWEQKGGFFRKRILIGAPKDQKPEEVNLGDRIGLVFLKIRRKLVERGDEGKIIRSTNEHNSSKESVTLYESETKTRIAGVAEDLRKQYENLRTVQVVYALLLDGTGEPELVRLIVKGASLGSKEKDKKVPTFYSYISSFTGDDHFYQFKTTLTPILEHGAQDYYAINFERGEKLSETSYAFAMEQMKKVHENCAEIDTARAMRIVNDSKAAPGVAPEDQEVHTETEGLSMDEIADSIPF